MKILLSSYAFSPSVGGLEQVSEMLARDLAAHGHLVVLMTMTPAAGKDEFPFIVIRRPRLATLFRAIRWSDIYVQQNISLRLAWPLLLLRRPWIICIHGTLFGDRGFGAARKLIKRFFLRFAHLISVSRAMVQDLHERCIIIPNPYRDELFCEWAGSGRAYDLVFVGRLVSDKGTSLVIEAVHRLRLRGIQARALIIGAGPEEPALRAQCGRYGLAADVEFAGMLRGEALVEQLNKSRIMVVPSLVDEGFGVVALEGIACGCVVVASEAGGLPEAIGPCGLTFRTGDILALTDSIASLLQDDAKIAALRHHAQEHLAQHRRSAVADRYLETFCRIYREFYRRSRLFTH